MRRILQILLSIFLMNSFVYAGQNNHFQKLSPALNNVLISLKERKSCTPNLPKGSSGKGYLSLIVKKKTGTTLAAKAHGWHAMIGTETGNAATVYVAPEAIEPLALDERVEYVDIAPIARPVLDVSVSKIGADLVQEGAAPLSRSYRGKDVVVGIIDTGIDVNHLDFRTENGDTRILYLWDQTVDGKNPASYQYGSEWTAHDINAGLCSETDGSESMGHGTHVAGIAAGNGNALGKYTGVAPDADLIVVKTDFNFAHILDGIAYILDKAGGKPSVINLSLSTHQGPHDGTSLPERMIKDLVGPGKVVVAAASNEGNDPIHLGFSVSEGITYGGMFYSDNPATPQIEMDIWYNEQGNISFAIAGFDSLGNWLTQTAWVAPGQNISNAAFMANDRIFGLVTVDARETLNPFNNSRHVFVKIDSDHQKYEIHRPNIIWALLAKGSGTFDAWLYDGKSVFDPFSGQRNNIQFMSGDSYSTVGIPGTAPDVICVGAFSTKKSWLSTDGNYYSVSAVLGDWAPFSSMGPTRDGRIKPDIAAPGFVIASAMSGDADILNLAKARVLPGEQHWVLQGTSMAAPHVTGAVALMLEQTPSLTPQDVTSLLKSYATVDEFTGATPNNRWGAGKMDLFAVMTAQTSSEVVTTEIPAQFVLEQSSPNPYYPLRAAGSRGVSIGYRVPGQEKAELVIFNLMGQVVFHSGLQSSGSHSVFWWNGRDNYGRMVAPGVYFYRLRGTRSGKVLMRKLIVLH